MKKRLTYISPLQQGIVVGVLYAILSLIAVPFLLIASLIGHAGISAFAVIFIPIIYGIVGFIGGIIAALVYNLVAKWTGGLEFVLIDV